MKNNSIDQAKDISSEQIEDISSEQILTTSLKPNTIMSKENDNSPSTSQEVENTEKQSESTTGQLQWQLPVTEIKINDEGKRFVEIVISDKTHNVLVPQLPPETANVVVVASPDANTQQLVFHVYALSPSLGSNDS